MAYRIRCLLLTIAMAALTLVPPLTMTAPATAEGLSEREAFIDQAFSLFSPVTARRSQARKDLVARGKLDAVPALILALRYARVDEDEIDQALRTLTGAKVDGAATGGLWHQWMIWQERHPAIVPFDGFDRLLLAIVSRHDPNFATLLRPGVAHEIRLSEIVWGGVALDGIPALVNPKLIAADQAKYLQDDDIVFGVSINGDARAYPLRIMDWHEMFNDVVGGVPVSLAYCTLCGSGVLFEGQVPGRAAPLVFGSSGFLYRSNKLMYDTATRSLWNQFTGRPVVGPLTGSGITLKTRPVAITTWQAWRQANLGSRVLSPDTGFDRNYASGAAYGRYFSSPELMFPAAVDEAKLKAKDYVFALRGSEREKAWPLKLFEGGRVINDTAGAVQLTLVGEAATRTVRAYRTNGEAFQTGRDRLHVALDGAEWRVTEDALVGPAGETRPRLPGHIAFWFAWNGYLGKGGEVAIAK